MARDRVVFYLNGIRHEVGGDQSMVMLADYLRYERALVGTKVVCAEGDCGACTVLQYVPRPKAKGDPLFLPINSCVMTLGQLDGTSLVSVEGIARGSELSPVQKAMVGCHGSQCGYCTPGFVMAMTGLVEKKLCTGAKGIEPQAAKNALTGNLCRCTGYQPIIDAAVGIELKRCESLSSRHFSPEQARALKRVRKEALRIEGVETALFAPLTLKEAAAYLKKHRDARLLAGGTDLGVVHNKRKIRLKRSVSLHLVPELYEIRAIKGKSGPRLRVGARVTLTELREAVKERIPEFARFLDLFASPQIKNAATLVGNVGNASPIADTPPFLLVANADVHVQGPRAARVIPLDRYYLAYRKTALKADELIAAIEFDIPAATEKLALYKVSQRKDLDISTVNLALRIYPKGMVRFAMGGVAATPVRLKKTEALLEKQGFSDLDAAIARMHEEITPISDLRGSNVFRRVAAENLVRRFAREHDGAEQ